MRHRLLRAALAGAYIAGMTIAYAVHVLAGGVAVLVAVVVIAGAIVAQVPLAVLGRVWGGR